MAAVTVRAGAAPYTVLVGRGALVELPRLVQGLGVSQAVVVTDTNVGAHWADPVAASLSGLGTAASVLAVEPGEGAKSLAELARVLAFFEDRGLDRRGLVVALGGGTVGDLAGFAAAVWLRGIRCIQVPTTLLAMVDSSVGGKTSVNTARTKNSVGAFWQPVAVVADLAALDTLPESEYRPAFAEICKYGVTLDAELAASVERRAPALLAREGAALEAVISRCVELKAAVVEADERESGPRQILNYGHTVGHAVEVATSYSTPHGLAVAYGMRVAVRIAEAMHICGPDVGRAQAAMLGAYGLDSGRPDTSPEAVLRSLGRDKKAVAGRARWVLPTALGRARVGVDVADPIVDREVRWLFA
ncbi:MAG: 3-dehydroquinate synthase [Candidatus Dormibacteraeota bacterium]|nr:3-dehydroquinate synthase [Candidatus Dormibacteraeota bacterium]